MLFRSNQINIFNVTPCYLLLLFVDVQRLNLNVVAKIGYFISHNVPERNNETN